jgi:hypothetical protein
MSTTKTTGFENLTEIGGDLVGYRDIDGWLGYRVGDDGSAWSCKDAKGRLTDKWHRLIGSVIKKGGYIRVRLSRLTTNIPKKEEISRPISNLVLEAFVGPRPRGMVACYRDEDVTNNKLDNLYWGPGPRRDRLLSGERHPSWKSNDVGKGGGRYRAQQRYLLGPCDRCGNPATDRHHKDTNTANNDPGNIELLCRRCHMIADGRMERFVAAKGGRKDEPNPPKPCVICGRLKKPLRKGRCDTCDSYFRKYGVERTPEAVEWWHKSHPSSQAGFENKANH